MEQPNEPTALRSTQIQELELRHRARARNAGDCFAVGNVGDSPDALAAALAAHLIRPTNGGTRPALYRQADNVYLGVTVTPGERPSVVSLGWL